MSTYTQHYNFKRLGPQDGLNDDGSKFGTTDRDVMDREIYRGATHHHTGAVSTVVAPIAPALQMSATPGNLLPSTRYYYKITYINGAGDESLASPESYIDTPAPVASPSAPVVVTSGAGGLLASGNYFYALSAYSPDATRETIAGTPTMVTTGAGSTNKNTVTLPTLPAGAIGFNLYRLVPSGIGYFLLATIPMNITTPPSTYVDTGSAIASAERTLPISNTTNSHLAISVSIGGTTPTVPPGMLWRIYRTAVQFNYAVSLITTITDGTPTYLDLGAGASTGSPPVQSGTTAPDKVRLTDAAEIQGVLPPANFVRKEVIQFRFPGPLTAQLGPETWRCPYDEFLITEVLINLGRGSAAASSIIVVDVEKYATNATTPTWTTIFSNPVNRPRILVGSWFSASTVPTTTKIYRNEFLSPDIFQGGGGATPTDKNLLIQIVGYVFDSRVTSVAP